MADMLKTDRKTYTADFIRTDSDRSVILGNAISDNLFTAVLALSAELWAVRRRQRITEALLEKHGGPTPAMIEAYLPSEAETARWNAERDAFVKTLMDPFIRTADIPYGSTFKSPSDPTSAR